MVFRLRGIQKKIPSEEDCCTMRHRFALRAHTGVAALGLQSGFSPTLGLTRHNNPLAVTSALVRHQILWVH